MKRFILEKPLKKGERDLEVWVCNTHYDSFLRSKKFQQLAGEYDCIMILEGVTQGIPQICWICAQNDGDYAEMITYGGDQFIRQAL